MPIGPANIAKYRLGPPSSIILDANTSNSIDLGSSLGGVTFTYSPTFFKAIPDQIIGAVAVWRTQEEGDLKFSMPEVAVNKLLAAFSYPTSGVVTTLSSAALGAPAAGSQVVVGTAGAIAYGYSLFAYNSYGDGIPVACTPAITTGNLTLTSSNYNLITFPALPTGAVGFGVVRTTGGTATTVAAASNQLALPTGTITVASTTGFAASGTATVVTSTGIATFSYTALTATTFTGCTGGSGFMTTGGVVSQYGLGLIARVTQSGGLPVSYSDTGGQAAAYGNSATQPASPNTDTGQVGNTIAVPVHQLDLVIPKNAPQTLSAVNLNWRWTFWSVVADAATAIDWKRDKNSEYAITLGLMMNTAQPQGQQLFRMVEEY